MTTGGVAALVALLALGFIEGVGRFYPSKSTWLRLLKTNGYRAVRGMRERLEAAAVSALSRRLATLLLMLVIVWIAIASLLDKRWHDVALDVLPYALAGAAVLRTRPALHAVVERMKEYERQHGYDPDKEPSGGDGGPTAIAL